MVRQRHWFGKVMGAGVAVLAAVFLLGQSALAAGIRVVPSVSRVLPGEDFFIDIVAENIPATDGLGAVQFRLNVTAPGAKVAGVPDLNQAAADSVALATPLLISAPTATRSGLGAFFLPPTQGSGGILVMDNEPLQNGSAQYTYAHTHGASRPSGTGSVARFQVRVGSAVAAEAITFTLTDVLLLDGGPAYPLDSNVGATVTLRCTSVVPALTGKPLVQAQAALTQAGLALGSVYEIDNLAGSQPLGVVLEQSAPAGSELDCETAVNLAVNSAPAEITHLVAVDRAGDDTGRVQLSWIASASNDTAGYRIYLGGTRLLDLTGAQTTMAEVGGLPVGITQTLRVTAVDGHGNESTGVTVSAMAIDDVPPQATVSGVTEGTFYRETVTPQVTVVETNPATRSLTLNGQPYVAGTPITADGTYVLSLTVTDLAGHAVTATRNFTIDRAAPVITVNPPVAGNYYPEALTPVIAIDDAHLNAALTTYLLDGQPYQVGTPIGREGAHTLRVTAEDRAGNQSVAQIDFILDLTAPTVAIDGITDSAVVKNDVTPVIALVDTHLATSSVTLNGAPFVSGTPIAAEGEYLLTATASDLAGHTTTRSVRFVIDRTAPESRATLGTPTWSGTETLYVSETTTATLAAVDPSPVASGVAALAYAFDGAAWTDYASALTFAALDEGAHALAYRAIDRAGNEESTRHLAVTVDRSAPQTAITVAGNRYDAGATLFVTGTTSFSLTAVDTYSGVAATEYRVDAGDWTAFAPFTVSGDGDHVIAYRSRDNLGHQEVVKTFTVTTDNVAPVSSITVGMPQVTDAAGNLYIAAETPVTATASDAGSGVALLETRLDSGAWVPYAPLTIVDEGPHRLAVRGTDALGNRETEQVLSVIVDTRAPEATLMIGTPQVAAADGRLFITSATTLTVRSEDDWAGVGGTVYRLDGGAWLPAAPFTIATEGVHRLDYYGTDRLGHEGVSQLQVVAVDNTPPTTRILFAPQGVVVGNALLVSPATEVTLVAEDGGAGVRFTFYRFDAENTWRSSAGPFHLTGLNAGAHTLHYVSEDRLGNRESEQSVAVTLVASTIDVSVLNLPRVLVWTEDPATATGNSTTTYTLAEVRALVNAALGGTDAYVQVVTDKAAFKAAFRSGLYNEVMILGQDVPFAADILRELREAVAQGRIGLLASSWGNNVHPLLQTLFGLDFTGSMPMDEAQRRLILFDSEVSNRQELTASGRILKTRLTDGTLAGVVPGDSQCSGVRSVSFRYPTPIETGARVTVTAYTQQGKKLTLADEEQGNVTALPMGRVNTVTGNPAGDVAIDGIAANGVSFTLAAPYTYLDMDYQLTVKVEHSDGSATQSGNIVVTPTCAANLVAGVNVGPYQVLVVNDDRVKVGDDLPAVVLNRYGAGRTVFLAYDLLASALESGSSAHADLLGKAAGYLLPDAGEIEPAGIALFETTVSLAGTELDLTAIDTLDPGLTHLPLFNLTQTPLEFRFHLTNGDTASYRYFVRFPDQAGEYQKETALFMDVEGGTIPFGSYTHIFALPTDSADLLQQAVFLVEELERQHPEVAASLTSIDVALKALALLPKTTAGDYDAIIDAILRVIQIVDELPFATEELQSILSRYLWIMEAGQGI